MTERTVAGRLRSVVTDLLGAPTPLRIRAWDGSVDGPAGAPTLVLRSPQALRYLVWSPGELGLARAYVTGEIDVDGDLAEGLRLVRSAVRAGGGPRRTLPAVSRTLLVLASIGALGRPLPSPATEARLRGRRHSRRRDAASISHHYDLSNSLYELLLDRHMAYSCAYWTSDEPGYMLADAQRDKLDLVCRKLDLRPGRRLLDVGCGWGALAIHAAEHYGADVVGITLSREQLEMGQARVARHGLSGHVSLRLQDYRELDDGRFDAVAALEMGEHVGRANYPRFLGRLHALLRPEGRLLIQQMSHGSNAPDGGAFIARYIAPDMHMRPLHETVGLIEHAGFEVRDVHALREHYVRTVDAWRSEFERRYGEVVAMLGEEWARVWRLYLVGGALAFEQNRMGVDQFLAVKTTALGGSGMPPTRRGWETAPAELSLPSR